MGFNVDRLSQELIYHGFTNHASDDLGMIASSKPKKSYAFCCDEVITQRSRNDCPRCKHALFWQTNGTEYAEQKIADFIKKVQEKRAFYEERRKARGW